MLAHITKDKNGIRLEQSLAEHSINTASYAGDALAPAGLQNCAYLSGLLHDMGKAKEEFQEYLKRSFEGEKVIRGSVNHTFAGVIYILEKYHNTEELKKGNTSEIAYITSELIAYAIGAHHGLFDCCDLDGNNGFLHRLNKDKNDIGYEETCINFFRLVASEEETDRLFSSAVGEIELLFTDLRSKYNGSGENAKGINFEISMISRMLLSAVIYGDRRDTIEFMDQEKYTEYSPDIWDDISDHFLDRLGQMSSDSYLNKVRADISAQCSEFAEHPSGVYRMNIPTGGGKTLCSMRYALDHAGKYNKNRIFFVIPLLSILDQNAKVIREYLPDDSILLEHHSNVVDELDDQDDLDRYELLTTGYDSPVIVTTLVQLLNILFSHKTSSIGRMRALVNSVIVIDEVQSLPKKTVLMFNMAINYLADYCNTTVIMSSATQPGFDSVKWPLHYSDPKDMVRLLSDQKKVFDRASITCKVSRYGYDIKECSDFCNDLLSEYSTLLVICNTKKEALSIYKEISKNRDLVVYHLSTSMCKSHRGDVLKEIIEGLSDAQRMIREGVKPKRLVCVSTQLVEAGVDFSFEAVVRIMAGIDNLAQAAGRCNRSGEYQGKGQVFLMNLKEEKLKGLPDIKAAKDATLSVLHDRGSDLSDLTGEVMVERYFKRLFNEIKSEIVYPAFDDGTSLSELLANKNPYAGKSGNGFFMKQPFLSVGKEFNVFDDKTIDVLVPYKDGADIIDELEEQLEEDPYALSKISSLIRRLKAFTVGIYNYQKEKLEEFGMIYPLLDGRINVLRSDAYSEIYGLNIPDELNTETFII